MRAFAERAYDLIIGVGFAQAPIMEMVARDYPHIHFAIVDGVSEVIVGPPADTTSTMNGSDVESGEFRTRTPNVSMGSRDFAEGFMIPNLRGGRIRTWRRGRHSAWPAAVRRAPR